MSAAVQAMRERGGSAHSMTSGPIQDLTLEAVAVWRALPGALILLGWAAVSIPASGSAHLQHQKGGRGIFRSVCWPGSRPNDGHAFLMAVRLPAQADPPEGASLLLRGEAGPALSLMVPSGLVSDAGFGQQVAQLSRSHSAEVARFILDVLRPSGSRGTQHAIGMIRDFLNRAGQADGCIELMTAVPDGCVLLQGWGAPLSGPLQVILAGEELPCFEGHAGEFVRNDIAAPASGVLLVLPPAAVAVLPRVEQVFVLSDHGVHIRALVEHRLLDAADSLGHIRHMMPSLRGPAPILAMLKESTRARFEGHDTLHGSPRPVRAAIDTALVSSSAGAYLAGWVFDPARLITALHLCGTAGYFQRLDETWTRVPRQDVTEAFENEPGFPPPRDDASGFSASSAAAPALGEALYLQFSFADGELAFVPLVTGDPGDAAVRARLLESVDLFKHSGLPILERHVAPLLARARPNEPAPAQVLLRGPLQREHAIVVPLAAAMPPRTLIADLLHDPALDTEQLVLVCGPEWDLAALAGLSDLVRFYGLPASILVSGSTATAALALREAARAAAAITLLVLGAGVTGAARGWRDALRQTARTAVSPGCVAPGFVCPTLLYEDWSIRYAGSPALRFQDSAPYTSAFAPLTGLPAALASGLAARPAALGTLECCLVLRSALMAASGDGGLSTDLARDIVFFTQLQSAGIGGVWDPAVQVYAPETAYAETAHAEPTRAAALVDGWILRGTYRTVKEA